MAGCSRHPESSQAVLQRLRTQCQPNALHATIQYHTPFFKICFIYTIPVYDWVSKAYSPLFNFSNHNQSQSFLYEDLNHKILLTRNCIMEHISCGSWSGCKINSVKYFKHYQCFEIITYEKRRKENFLFSHHSSKDKIPFNFVYFYSICNILIHFHWMHVCSCRKTDF